MIHLQDGYFPNYQGGSIVNLMSSIGRAWGAEFFYPVLKELPPDELYHSRNIVMIVIDGLGYEYLKKQGHQTVLWKNLRGKMTSVFPSTTAACVTTFATGLAPQQHAVTGWYMLLKELGIVAKILPFVPRNGGEPFSKHNVKAELIFKLATFSQAIKGQAYAVMPQDIVNSDYTKFFSRGAKKVSYSEESLPSFFRTLKSVIYANNHRKFIYAYWSEYDSLCHDHGTTASVVKRHFQDILLKFSTFVEHLHGTNSTIIVTADHGFIDTGPDRRILLKDHPQLMRTLSLPFCGEPRATYCYVHPARAADFERYVTERLSNYCQFFKSEELIQNNIFGLGEPNEALFDRVGDYVLVMKENYVIKDFLPGEEVKFHIGVHGGVSKEEMFVPLVVLKY